MITIGRKPLLSETGKRKLTEVLNDQTVALLCSTLDPASFYTIWKCLVHSRHFLSRAFNDSAIRSAYEKSGIFVPDNGGSFSPITIMSQCPHWQKLSTDDAQWVIDQLPHFHRKFEENFYLPEESFQILAERNGIDNSNETKGKELNDLVTNRQRCMILGNNNHLLHQQMREDERNQQQPQKSNAPKCFACNSEIPLVERKSKNMKCAVKKCRKRICGSEGCLNILQSHQILHQATEHRI